MTQSSQPFSVRTGRAQSRPPQTENFDEETIIRLKRAMTPIFCQMGENAKALVDGFFTPTLDRGLLREGYLVLRCGDIQTPVSCEVPPNEDLNSKHIDWRVAIQDALDCLLGGDNWPIAFDLCEFLLAKHDELIGEQERRIELMREMPTPFGPSIAAQNQKNMDARKKLRERAIRETNKELERMNVGYRLREQTGRFDSIISSASGAVNDVLALSADSVRKQMTQAVAAFGPHSGGDYGTAVHKAMSAVWAAMEICTGEKKFGTGIQKLRESEKLHPALAKALGSLYGFTSQDGKGMRHPEFEGELPPDMATARFVVEACASFIAYIAESHPDKFERKREKNRPEDIPF